ncbi:MAG: hypothetical protein HOF88_04675 [Euryarchaeota archaeon]|jgi:hypothetical protein|nr:hypothetical protein [Euryarchaeota archaeon]
MALCLNGGCLRIIGHPGACISSLDELGTKDMAYMVKCLDISDADYRKITKSKQSAPRNARSFGAQNRVERSGKVVIPLEHIVNPSHWLRCAHLDDPTLRLNEMYPMEWIIRVTPRDYYNYSEGEPLSNLEIGADYFVHYTSPRDLEEYPPLPHWNLRLAYDVRTNQAVAATSAHTEMRGEYLNWINVNALGSPSGGETRFTVGHPQGNPYHEYTSRENNIYAAIWYAFLMAHTETDNLDDSICGNRQREHLTQLLAHFGIMPERHQGFNVELNRSVCPVCSEVIDYDLLHRAPSPGDPGIGNAGSFNVDTRTRAVNLYHITDVGSMYMSHQISNICLGHFGCNFQMGQTPSHAYYEMIEDGSPVSIDGTSGYISSDNLLIRDELGRVFKRIEF